jgi:hypothetical protein
LAFRDLRERYSIIRRLYPEWRFVVVLQAVEVAMPARFKVLAVAAALMAGTSGAAMAQCTPGYMYYNGACQLATPGYSNPVSGAASGLAQGTASGNATGGPVGAIVGGALGTAAGTLAGTANLLTRPTCAYYYNGVCYRN